MSKGISLHIGLNFVDPDHYGGWDGELAACENDARDMASIAQAQGFETSKLIREAATREAVTTKLTEAAANLTSGDILWVSYSGHGGQVPDMDLDEDDDMDETWCLYNGQLIDDELLAIWAKFAEGVRILVVSDSCHSGTVTREALADPQQYTDLTPRFAPSDVVFETYMQNRAFYEDIASQIEETDEIKATVRLISGCQDNQYSYDGTFNGQFTGKLKRVWRDGAFEGNYSQFHNRILRLLPAHQTPNHYVFGMYNPAFEEEKPFTI